MDQKPTALGAVQTQDKKLVVAPKELSVKAIRQDER